MPHSCCLVQQFPSTSLNQFYIGNNIGNTDGHTGLPPLVIISVFSVYRVTTAIIWAAWQNIAQGWKTLFVCVFKIKIIYTIWLITAKVSKYNKSLYRSHIPGHVQEVQSFFCPLFLCKKLACLSFVWHTVAFFQVLQLLPTVQSHASVGQLVSIVFWLTAECPGWYQSHA